VFLAHSLGGIVVKEALVYARLATTAEAQDFFQSTRGVLFFGTPHYGSDWSGMHAAYLKFRSLFAPATPHVAKLLSKSSEYLAKLHSDFTLFSSTLEIRYFFEELPVLAGIWKIVVGCAIPSRGPDFFTIIR
jgi:hypothetical protein